MKIWVIGRGYPTVSNGMWGSFELEQAKLLARNGHDVSYIALTLSFFSRKDPRGMRAFEDNGVNVYTYSHLYFPGKAGIYLEKYEDKCWHRLFDAAEKNGGLPDVIHIHYPSMLSSINEVEKLRKKGVKIVVTEHWSRVLINNLRKFERARLEYYASHVNCFACVSNALQKSVKKLSNVTAPMEIIPNIVSPLFFDSKPEKKESDIFTFVAVGRLVPLKQFDVIIEQFKSVFSGNDKVRLKIIGSGSERKKLEKLAAGNDNIIITGGLPQSEVATELSNADALISYSKYETFAVPVAEAWACGKPVIVSERSGIASAVKNEKGYVVKNDSVESLKTAIKDLYDGYSIYSAETIRDFASGLYCDSAVFKSISSIYEKY